VHPEPLHLLRNFLIANQVLMLALQVPDQLKVCPIIYRCNAGNLHRVDDFLKLPLAHQSALAELVPQGVNLYIEQEDKRQVLVISVPLQLVSRYGRC